MMKTALILFISMLVTESDCWRSFFRGKVWYKNLVTSDLNSSGLPEEKWFLQKLDHFDPTNSEEWRQRYFINDSFYDQKNGPVFLMIGGEAEANPKWVINGTWLKYAEKYNALCILLEHRYYGKSHPVSDLGVKNLLHLTSEQALADIAAFITNYNNVIGRHVQWIVFGGSYPGSLAAWMRLKYPHLVLGAVSSSGPLLAVADFQDYYEIVEEALSSHSKECVQAIQEGTSQLTKLLAHRDGQLDVLRLFSLCDPIDISNKDDIANLYEILASNFAGVVQYNKDNRFVQNPEVLQITIDIVCDAMTSKAVGNEVNRLALVNYLILQYNNETCLDYNYRKMIKEISSSDWFSKAANGMRQWTYQTCTEFGFFQTPNNNTKKLFGDLFTFNFFEKQCMDIFGKKFDKNLLNAGISRTNMLFGGLDIHTDNVVFVHGSIDPWHALGITKTLRKSSPAIYIKDAAHCSNMYPSSAADSPQLVSARNEIERLIGLWLTK